MKRRGVWIVAIFAKPDRIGVNVVPAVERTGTSGWTVESQTTDKVANGQCGSKTESVTLELTKRLTLLELREKLLGSRSLSRPSAASSVWKQTLEEFEQWIFAVLSPNDSDALSLVPAPHSLPFCEVFYGPTGEAVMRLTRNYDPPLIGSVHRALSNPECLIPKTNGSQSLGSDLCIVYKIYMEGGSLINVHDWLIAFEAIVEPSPGRTDANPSQLIQSRFLRAVADLVPRC
ncbi:Origin recognition complex subunit 3 [Taenia crassiceps]|uniref:Origin recognition complex subunit 3 n=1 Tax=Taenia crassiceps TaxID=6207 RepID=A0ABR4PZM6_9CEST